MDTLAAAPTTRMPESFWIASTGDAPDHPPLRTKLRADVCVIGGGVTGMTTALLLQRTGASVVVLEADRVGAGVSGHTTAKVTVLHTAIYQELVERFGRGIAHAYAQANHAGLQQVAAFVEELGLECDFRRKPAYTYAESDRSRARVEAEATAARAAGLAAELVERCELPFRISAAVRVDDQAEFHPRRYLLGLAAELTAAGGRIFERSRATGVSWGRTPTVRTGTDAGVRADHVVVATLMPFLDRGLWWSRLTPSRSYAVLAHPGSFVPHGMYISLDQPTRSLRATPVNGTDALLVGGEGHLAGEGGDTRRRYAALEADARTRLGSGPAVYRWSAHDLQPADGLPYVGPYTPLGSRVLMAAGYRKWGFTNATAAAIMLADRILGRGNPWAAAFSSTRFTPRRSAAGVAKEALKDARHLVADRARRGEARPLAEIGPGDGALAEVDGRLVAVHRDDDGVLHGVSAACSHLGCRLGWNPAERSWDCPCHGSRFAPDGAILQGPATRPLRTVAVAEAASRPALNRR